MKPASARARSALAWQQYICRVCGLVYDEARGDADSGLAPGTRFEDIPDDWACPICGVTKADFEPWSPPAADASGRAATATRAPLHSTARGNNGVVVVGAGRAGWQLVQCLRALDAERPITLVSACSGDRYDKPLISVALARGLDPASMVRESAAAAAARLGVGLLCNAQAVSVDLPRRHLRTTRGTLRYSHLVLAQGAEPAVPAVLPPQWVWRMNDLATYTRLRATLQARGPDSQHVAIVGAGLVGCELANDLALAGHRITLLDSQPRPLAALLPAQASQGLLQAWGPLPLRFIGDVQVKAVQPAPPGHGGGYLLSLSEGTAGQPQPLQVDHVIAATGLRTASRLARSAGLAFDDAAGGIVVDAHSGATSQSGVYALGDCVAIAGRASRYIEPILQQAQGIAQAIVAGSGSAPALPQAAAAAGSAGAPALRVKTSSLPITLTGHLGGDGEWHTVEDSTDTLRLQRTGLQGDMLAELVARRVAPRVGA